MQDDISDNITLSIMPIYHIALSCPLQYATGKLLQATKRNADVSHCSNIRVIKVFVVENADHFTRENDDALP